MKKVLLIEDSAEILNNLSEFLELSNYKVFTADNGKEGIEQAMMHKPDVIVCDIMMPELDGFGVLHILQHNPDLQKTPFIFLTAKTDPVDYRKGMILGADDYIVKPFDPTDLLNSIETQLRKADNRRAAPSNSSNYKRYFTEEKTLEQFLADKHVNHYRKKQLIYTEGNHAVRVYYVDSGKVKIYKCNDDGKELITKVVVEKQFFGYPAVLENTTYRESAQALEDSDVKVIPRHEFEELLADHPEIARLFASFLAKDLTEKEEQLLGVAYNSLRRKVADALLQLEHFYESSDGQGIRLSRENLAAVAGTATESLIRTLTDFKHEKLIDMHDGVISILNREKLQNFIR